MRRRGPAPAAVPLPNARDAGPALRHRGSRRGKTGGGSATVWSRQGRHAGRGDPEPAGDAWTGTIRRRRKPACRRARTRALCLTRGCPARGYRLSTFVDLRGGASRAASRARRRLRSGLRGRGGRPASDMPDMERGSVLRAAPDARSARHRQAASTHPQRPRLSAREGSGRARSSSGSSAPEVLRPAPFEPHPSRRRRSQVGRAGERVQPSSGSSVIRRGSWTPETATARPASGASMGAWSAATV